MVVEGGGNAPLVPVVPMVLFSVMATLTRDMSCSQLFQRLDCEPKNLDKSLGMIKIWEKTKESIKRRACQIPISVKNRLFGQARGL